MARGGFRVGSGLKKGQKIQRKKLPQSVVKDLVGTGQTPLEYLLSVMRDKDAETDHRLDAAKGAAPYVHKKMPTDFHVAGADGVPLAVEIITPMSRRSDGDRANPPG